MLTIIIFPLDCYDWEEPQELPDGMIRLCPARCTGTPCVLAKAFHIQQKELGLLIGTIRSKRLETLVKLQSSDDLRASACRHLGDAVFALLAPLDSVILTTNLADHKPLAECLGKQAIEP